MTQQEEKDKLSKTIQSISTNIELAQKINNTNENNPMYNQLLSVLTDLQYCVKTLTEIVIPNEQEKQQ